MKFLQFGITDILYGEQSYCSNILAITIFYGSVKITLRIETAFSTTQQKEKIPSKATFAFLKYAHVGPLFFRRETAYIIRLYRLTNRSVR